jgi:lipopolysaccharide transport system ATP-binding protein
MNTAVRFENISKRYNLGLTRVSLPNAIANGLKALVLGGEHSSQDQILWALKDVDFELKQGQSLAIIGPNGAGKTTILKLLANITKPTSGNFTINGRLSALIELGAGFHPDLTGRENIFLNGAILGLRRKEIERRFDEIVDFSELDRFIDTPVKRYSSGMTVRLGFAVASCMEPDILLVDEVLAVGDASFQQKCLKRIRSLMHSGTSIIFISHNLYLVQAACDVALYLQKGQVKHYGSIKDVFDMYEEDIHQERAQRYEHTQLKENADNDDIEITKVEIGADGKFSVPELYSNQPVQIRISYNAYKSLGKVQVSAFIFRSDGVTCCMARTKLDGFDVFVERGQGIIILQLTPLQLVGGAYYVEAGILDESDSMNITSRVGRSDWFTVQGKALSFNENSVYEPNTQWMHEQNTESVVNVFQSK